MRVIRVRRIRRMVRSNGVLYKLTLDCEECESEGYLITKSGNQISCPKCSLLRGPSIDNAIKNIRKMVDEMIGIPDGWKGFVKGLVLGNHDQSKWYDHPDHMKILSEKFSNIGFILSGEGEEAGDMWIKYYLDGVCTEYKMPEWVPPSPPWDKKENE